MSVRHRLVRRRVLAASVAAVAAFTVGPMYALAADERVMETGRVTDISDGDTPYVDIAGDGSGRSYLVRMNGIQAPEIDHPNTHSKNWCHGFGARNRLSDILRGKQVQLRSVRDSHVENGRRLRNVFVKRDGAWKDVQKMMLKGGWVLWEPRQEEPVHNRDYHVLAERAAREGRHLWDTDSCGKGPYQNSRFKVWVVWDADGTDGENLNGEQIVIKNLNKDVDVNLSGWHVRDSSLEMLTFPKGTVLPAGKRIRVHVGRGTADKNDFYFNRSSPLFPNTDAARGMGDGGYLMDRDGDYRAWATYPCVIDCADPLREKLAITDVVWDPEGPDSASQEYVRIKNVSDQRLNLDGYVISSPPYTYMLWGERLDPGVSLTLRVGKGVDHDQVRYWNKSKPMFGNSGDMVMVINLFDVVLDCEAWRGASCP